jgi:lipopolysaccharide assembly outer membrane protein LptD (OstA)
MVIIFKSAYFGQKYCVSLTPQIMRHIFTKIVFKPLRTNLFHIVLLATFLTLGIQTIYSQDLPKNKIAKPTNKQPDSLTISTLDLDKKDKKTDIDSAKIKKGTLESIVRRKAVDYEQIDQKTKIVTLYNKAELYYQDIELKSGIIVMDYAKNEVYAGRIKDSLGNYTQLPNFKQGANVVEPDSIRFNFNTKKALVWNSRTKQGEMNIIAEKSKKENDSVYFMKRAKITTSKDVNNPEYYFLARKAKFVPGKKVVVGLTNMYIEEVPTPIGMPFAFFPMTQKSQSGIILPTFQDTNARGYSLQNFGYYLALSDNYDLTFMGDYYTNGSYAMRFESSYATKYKYRGNVNIRYENLITSERGFLDYAKTNVYNIQWSHAQDAKANPNARFSASVNMGSSTYFQNSLNQINTGSRLNNTLSSSVSYSKTFNTVPSVNLSLTATHSQNTQTKTINMTLPTMQLSVDRIFPFAPKDGAKKGFFKNINLQYSVKAENRIATTDTLFFKPQMFRDAKTGMQHSIPLSTNFKLFKHFSVTTGANYNEVWYLKTINKAFDSNTDKVVTTEINGFDSYRTYSFSNSIGTTIYGTFNFGADKRIKVIRHVMRPSISHSYAPSFAKYYDTYATDASGKMRTDYSRFDNGIYGGPGNSYSHSLGFSLNNTFEAKVTDRDTTKTEPKKVMLLNNLNFSTGYNLAATSMPWDPVRVSGGTLLFKDKMNVNFGATLDPYALDNAGKRIDKYNINNGGSLFRLTSANMTLNYSLSSKSKDKSKKKNTQGERNGGRSDDLFGNNTDLNDRRQSQFSDDDSEKKRVDDFYNSKIPWDLTLAYSLTYGNSSRENSITNNSLMVSGNIELSPKWKVGVSSGYDLVQKGITYTNIRIERDLLSWRMNFNWTPLGVNAYWGFFIGIKAGMLSDIKWEKRKTADSIVK